MADAYQQVIDKLSPCKKVLITTHVRPDGDALGSCAAMHLALRKLHIDSEILLLSHLPRKYSFVFNDHGIPHIDAEPAIPSHFQLDHYDALAVVDTGTWSQLPDLEERVTKWPKPKIVIDHHLTQEDWADVKLVDTSAAAAGEIVAQVIDRWRIPLDLPLATVLYVAIVSDTGWFQFSNTRPETLRLGAKLMELGVDTDRIYQMLYQNERAERVALQTRAQDSLELLADGRLAVMTIRKEDFHQTRASVADTENLINIPLQIASVEVAILVTEPLDNGPVRISLRSKGQIDVARFAEEFGGGGHARASGLKLSTNLSDARDQVVAAMVEQMQNNRPTGLKR